ncbi:BRO family protein [Muribacter muris]|uniref:BRO family protein n=1 Tax=Muribacter muris TaxID=67855 RepID=UPI00064E147A|nr:BRO family protein [Muribacter muris]
MTTLTFQNTTLSVIDQHNQKWLPALEVGRALGYSNPSVSISQLYDRNKDEFTSSMTAIIDMDTASGIQKVRIFSLRGCWLLGMRSHTKVAKDFRKWVLDILDKEVSQNPQPNLPLVEPPKMFKRELTEKEMQDLCWAWYALRNYIELTDTLQKQFGGFGGDYAYAIRQLNERYRNLPQEILPVLQRITAEFKPDNIHGNGWERILHSVQHPNTLFRVGRLIHLF